MKKLKFAVLVLCVGLMASNAYAGSAVLSDLAASLEHESRLLMRTLSMRVGGYHPAYRQAHALYHAARDFSYRCSNSTRRDRGARAQYLHHKFAHIEGRFYRLRQVIETQLLSGRLSSIRRDFRRVESRFYVLRNSIGRLENNVSYEADDYASIGNY